MFQVVERFNAAVRVTGAGDCEDMAREILNVAQGLRSGSWSLPLVKAAQVMVRCYVVVLQLGCIAPVGRGAGRTDVYSTGSYDAHAWVMMLPVRLFVKSMREAQVDDLALDPFAEATVPMLTLDGTTGKQTYPNLARARVGEYDGLVRAGPMRLDSDGMPQWTRQLRDSVANVKMGFPEGAGNYAYVLESFLLGGLQSGGVGVRQFFYLTGDKYGVRYDSLYDCVPHRPYHYAGDSVGAPTAGGADTISVQPAVVMTAEEERVARLTMARFVPIPPMGDCEPWWDAEHSTVLGLPARRTDAEHSSGATVRAALRDSGVMAAPWEVGRRATPVVLLQPDASNAAQLAALLRSQLDSGSVGPVRVRAESIRSGAWHVHVRVEEPLRAKMGGRLRI